LFSKSAPCGDIKPLFEKPYVYDIYWGFSTQISAVFRLFCSLILIASISRHFLFKNAHRSHISVYPLLLDFFNPLFSYRTLLLGINFSAGRGKIFLTIHFLLA